MFWNMMGQFDSPQIDNLLERENVTLIELLDEDQLLNELIHRNDRLIQYLCKEEVLKEMIDFITTDSTYTEHSLDDCEEFNRIQLRYKRANQVTELLNTDNEEVSKKLVESEDLLNQLMSILENTKTLNPLLACFFSKVVGSLLKQHPEETWNYLKNRENLISDIIRHMQTSGIADFIMRMVACSSDNEQVRSEIITWMVDEELVEKLIDLLNNDENIHSDVHTYAATALCELITILRQENSEAARCPLLNRLTQTSTIEKVIAQMLVSPIDGSVFVSAGSVLSTYMEKVQRVNLYPWADDSAPEFVSYYASAGPAVDVLSHHVPRLLKILHDPPSEPAIALPSGVLDPPLGKVRLHIVRLVSESIPQKMKSFFNAIKDTNLIETIISLFFKYDNNSFLSGNVHQIVYDILECDFDDELIISHLLDDCQVIEKFSDAWFQNNVDEKEGKPRKGYMGHLYNILKLLLHLSELHNDDDEEHSSHLMIRNKLINAHINEMSEDRQNKWTDIKQEISDMTDLLSRNLGKNRKTPNCSTNSDPAPSSASEDALARYQQKISSEFVDHFTLDDNPFDDTGLNNFRDVSKDRDDFLDECNPAGKNQNSEIMFEKMMDEKQSDWFGENEPDYDKVKDEPETYNVDTTTTIKPDVGLSTAPESSPIEITKPEVKEENMEKMDTSPPESSPWPSEESKNEPPPPAKPDTNFANFDTADFSQTNFANFESADFGKPTLSSSPQKEQQQKEDVSMETDVVEPTVEHQVQENGEGDASKQQNDSKDKVH